MRLGRAGIIGLALSFARSQRGQRMLRDARNRIDTPANRQRARDAVSRRRGPAGS